MNRKNINRKPKTILKTENNRLSRPRVETLSYPGCRGKVLKLSKIFSVISFCSTPLKICKKGTFLILRVTSISTLYVSDHYI